MAKESQQVIDGDAEELAPEEQPPPAMALEPAPPATATVAPQISASDLVDRLGAIREAQEKAMQRDVDYGVIPGTDKPALYKPGAEKLGVLFQLDIQLQNEKNWGPGDHLTVISKATVFHAPTGSRLGFGEGICTTRERKYGKRKQQRTCPSCGETAVIKGKEEYGGGWLCFKKKGGCGAKWPDGATEIESQEVGEIENPDLPDTWNTVVKMAEKRARVDAVLAVTGASALFTQDVEDQADPAGNGQAAAPAAVEFANAEGVARAFGALKLLIGDETVAKRVLKQIHDENDGKLPRLSSRAILYAGAAMKQLREKQAQDEQAESPDTPAPGTVEATDKNVSELCVCKDASVDEGRSDICPIEGHGIPF